MGDRLGLRGFFKVKLRNPDGSVAFETEGENTYTEAFRAELLDAIGEGATFASRPIFVSVGTGGAPVSNTTALPGELGSSTQRLDISTKSSVSASSRLRYTGQFASTAVSGDISNIGLFTSSDGSNLLCGAAFGASFNKSNNQALTVTYDITF